MSNENKMSTVQAIATSNIEWAKGEAAKLFEEQDPRFISLVMDFLTELARVEGMEIEKASSIM